MNKKKILMISSEGLGNGGVSSVIMGIVRNLCDEYTFDIILLTKEKRTYDQEFLSYGGSIYRIPVKGRDNPNVGSLERIIRVPKLEKGVMKIIKDNGPYHAIHCHNETESSVCLRAAKKCNVPIRISHAHIVDDLYASKNAFKRLYNMTVLSTIKKYATNPVGCSKEACEYLFHGLSYEVINNAVNLNQYNQYKDKVKRHTHSFIHIGRMGGIKNQIFIVKVFAEIHKTFLDSTLVLIGDGKEPYVSLLKEEIWKAGVGDVVRLLPGNSNIPSELAKARYMIFPSSVVEGFGIVLVEAQALGIKCFVSDCTPRAADAGLCDFYPLQKGEKWWAEHIISYMSEHETDEIFFPDMSQYDIKSISETYRKLYRG